MLLRTLYRMMVHVHCTVQLGGNKGFFEKAVTFLTTRQKCRKELEMCLCGQGLGVCFLG